MTASQRLGPLVHTFFVDHLVSLKGLRTTSIRSYRDAVRLLLIFVARERGCKITRLVLEDFSFDRVVAFLRYLERERGNHIRTRNQRLAVLKTFFEYIAGRAPEMLHVCQRVAAIPAKRVAPPETQYLERDEVETLLEKLPHRGRLALRDRALFVFLYNTGARVQEVVDLCAEHLDLDAQRVRLHGKGGKWRTCPLWAETIRLLRLLLKQAGQSIPPQTHVFTSARGHPLTRFGIYKIVRRHAAALDRNQPHRRVGPHIFRHTTAMHLLEAGVEVNVIRGWLGHADLSTTNRYAEINTQTKEDALRVCELLIPSAGSHNRPAWRSDDALLGWLASL